MSHRRRPWAQLPWVWGSPVTVPAPVGASSSRSPAPRLATRSVPTKASAEVLFLWLCQLRRAPYSYDWIDNFGRRSPRRPDPALLDLTHGQTFMTIFTLIAYEHGRSVTLRMKPGWPTRAFGALTVKYQIDPAEDAEGCQLTASLWMPPIGRCFGGLRRYVLAWLDLPMMRRQLLVLRRLATREATV